MIIVSFLTLAFTGMALKYADNPVFRKVNDLVGGPHIMGKIHMAGALIALLYVSIHLYQLAVLFVRRKLTLKGLFKEEYSMILLPRDFKELKAWDLHRPWDSDLWGKKLSPKRVGSYAQVLTDEEARATARECADVFHVFAYDGPDRDEITDEGTDAKKKRVVPGE